MNKYSILALLLFWVAAMQSQAQEQEGLPQWVLNPPLSTINVSTSVSTGSTLQEARHNAVNLLVAQMANLQYEPGSYQYQLLAKGQSPIDQHTALVHVAESSAFFKTLRQEETDTLCYILCEVTDQDYHLFCDSLYDAICSNVKDELHRIHSLTDKGDLFTAASVYDKCIEGLTPILHRSLLSDEGDLLTLLHDGYLHVLDGLEWRFDRQNCYMVPGEDLPVELWATAMCKGKPVPGLPTLFILSDNGKVISRSITDTNGRIVAHIPHAPDSQKAQLTVTLNLQAIEKMPQHIYSAELQEQLARHLTTAQLELTAFDPTPTFCLCLREEEMLHASDPLNQLLSSHGYLPHDQYQEADLLIRMQSHCQPVGEPTIGKYPMQTFISQMSISIVDRRSGKELARAEDPDMRLFVKAGTDASVLGNQAISEHMNRISSQLNEKIKQMKFDKRKVMFSL